jgi:hypothetical protein
MASSKIFEEEALLTEELRMRNTELGRSNDY